MTVEKILMFAPLPALSKRTRLAKMAIVARKKEVHIHFFGWERIKGEAVGHASTDPHITESTILTGGGYASSKARLLYPLWMLAVFWRVLRAGRGQVVFALGWETALPAKLASFITRSAIIFDDADRFSMILRLPALLQSLLRASERWLSRCAAMHIIPGYSRYEWRTNRMIVLRNSPLRADYDEARKAKVRRPDASLVLYANGWIGESRGAPVFLRMLEKANALGISLRLIIAGRLEGENAAKLEAHPLVDYVGEVNQREALSLYSISDAVLTYYDPAIPINRKAESNKWGDAIFLNCPIIVNNEVETAKRLVKERAAWSLPYCDSDALLELCVHLSNSSLEIVERKFHTKKFAAEYQDFDSQFEKILSGALGWERR